MESNANNTRAECRDVPADNPDLVDVQLDFTDVAGTPKLEESCSNEAPTERPGSTGGDSDASQSG
eukprot:2568090-Pyramimonas_sp.AAC.1